MYSLEYEYSKRKHSKEMKAIEKQIGRWKTKVRLYAVQCMDLKDCIFFFTDFLNFLSRNETFFVLEKYM